MTFPDLHDCVVVSVTDDVANHTFYRQLKLKDKIMVFVPYNRLEELDFKYKIITFSWENVYPVVASVMMMGWGYKFENVDKQIFMKTDSFEEFVKFRDDFSKKYHWPDAIPDPILHTDFTLISPDNEGEYTIHYGERISTHNLPANIVYDITKELCRWHHIMGNGK